MPPTFSSRQRMPSRCRNRVRGKCAPTRCPSLAS
jgi:hypothetical protein